MSPDLMRVLQKHEKQFKIQTSSPANPDEAEPVELEDIEGDEQQEQQRPGNESDWSNVRENTKRWDNGINYLQKNIQAASDPKKIRNKNPIITSVPTKVSHFSISISLLI